MKWRSVLIWAAVISILASVLVFAPACSSLESRINETRTRLVESRESATPEQQEKIDELIAALDLAKERISEIRGKPVRGAIEWISLFLPAWIREIVVAGTGVAIAVFQWLRRRRVEKSLVSAEEDAESIIRSIELVPEARQALTNNRRIVNAIQTPTARARVDMVQGKKV